VQDLGRNTRIWLVVAAVYLVALFAFRINEHGELDLGVVLDVMFAPLTLILLFAGIGIAWRERTPRP
jgi:hypothetical protein